MNLIKLSFLTFTTLFLFSCGSTDEKSHHDDVLSKEQMETQINELEIKLYGDSSKSFNHQAAESIIKLYTDFVAAFPEEEKAPNYLFKAGEISMSMNRSMQAIACFEQVVNNYPDFEKAPYCLFLQAFVFDNQVNDDEKAGVIYKEFIVKYPDHNMVKDAEFSIQNLGKTDEELIREFEAKLAKGEA